MRKKELINDSSALISKLPINTINSDKENVSNNDKGENEQNQASAEVNSHDIDSSVTPSKESNEDNLTEEQKIKKEERSRVAKSSPSRSFIGFSNNIEYENFVNYSSNYPLLNKLNVLPLGPGKVGLDNIGNTCFFNSGVQCLAHMACLVNYFETTNWKSELNLQNPLGMHGEMAMAFAEIVHVIWKGDVPSFTPSKLKSVIGQYASQFSGNDQQDVHELITFLLDGIHEDLNRRIDKPVVENVFGNGTNDEETAEKAWIAHKLRHDSIIVDLFHGQLRSKLDCPRCKCTTTVFDPYVTISVPLIKPENKKSGENRQKKLKIIYIPRDFSQKYKFFILDIKGNEDIYDICAMVKSKAKTSKTVVIGRYDQSSNEFMWGLSNKETQKKSKKKKSNKSDFFSEDEKTSSIFGKIFDYSDKANENENDDDDDTGEYIAFEVVDADYNQYWIPCFLKMKQMSFLSSTEKNIIGPFLLPCIDESPTEKELSDICETVILSIWEEYPESENEGKNESASDVDSDIESGLSTNLKSDKINSIFSTQMINESNKKSFFSNKIFSDYSFEDDSRVKVTKDGDIIFDENFPSLANSIVTARISKKATEEKNFSLKRLLLNFDHKTSSPLSMSYSFDREHVEKVSLEKCLKYFSMEEKLDNKNMWFCPNCREFVCAEKKMDIWSTPKNLILHLKRFITTEYQFGTIDSKLTAKVDYPLLLDMDPFIIGPNKKSSNLYRLKAVSEHVGTTSGGHYTAVALVDENYSRNLNKKRNKKNDSESESDSDDECFKWYLFNDSNVSKVTKKHAVSNDAYVLFYERMYDDHGEKNEDSATEYESKSASDEEEEEEEEANAQKDNDSSYSSEHRSPIKSNNDDYDTANEDDNEGGIEYDETVNENYVKTENIENEKSGTELINGNIGDKENVDETIKQNEQVYNENVDQNFNVDNEVGNDNDQVEYEEDEEEDVDDANDTNNDHQTSIEEQKKMEEEKRKTEDDVSNEFNFIHRQTQMESNKERSHFTSNDDDENNDVDVDDVDNVDNSNCQIC